MKNQTKFALVVALALSVQRASADHFENGRLVPDRPPPPLPAEIIGRVELIPGVPVTGEGRIFLEGTPLGARPEADGSFDVRRVPEGRWDLRFVYGDLQKRVGVGANAGAITDLGVVILSAPGSISGRVELSGMVKPGTILVGIPAQNLYVLTNEAGAYLLPGVAPGSREVAVISAVTPNARVILSQTVPVTAQQITTGVNFIQAKPADSTTILQGAPNPEPAPKLLRK